MLTGADETIGKRLVAVPSAPGVVPAVMAKRDFEQMGSGGPSAEPRRVPRLANRTARAVVRLEPCFRVGAGITLIGATWLPVSGRDSGLVGSLLAALPAEQNTAEPGPEFLRFVRRVSGAQRHLLARRRRPVVRTA